MKALIDRLLKSNEFLNAFISHNILDAEANNRMIECLMKNKIAIADCEKLVNEASTSTEALPMAGVVGSCSKSVHKSLKEHCGIYKCRSCGELL